MAAEQFWWMMRDVRPDPAQEPRRREPPYRYVGVVTCECVLQALAVLSLQKSPEPAAWPRYIGHSELALQRAVCVDASPNMTTGDLWESGAKPATLRWSYVPVLAWLKPYPAHSPQLLPYALAPEPSYVRPIDKHLMYLRHRHLKMGNAPALAPNRRLREMLGPMGKVEIRPLSACGAARCHGAGWCGVWSGSWGRGKRRCHCLADWTADSHQLKQAMQTKRRWGGPIVVKMAGGDAPTDDRCAPKPRPWVAGMERARYARTPEQFDAFDAEQSRFGPDRWRTGQPTIPRAKGCPNECLGRGVCGYGFCHCKLGYWGLDCGLSSERVASLAAANASPRIYVYNVPASLRRSCAPWTLPEDLGDRLLLSSHLEPDPSRADLFWVYGCPNGDTVLPMLRWIRRTKPYWDAAVREGRARHVIAVGHEEGWSEVWSLLGRWLGPNFDHANNGHGWDDLHPASPTRQMASVQLHGGSDYTADGHALRRGVSGRAPCRVCFQPGKDVVVPGFPGIMDYPDDHGRPALYRMHENHGGGRVSQCTRIAREEPYARLPDGHGRSSAELLLAPRKGSPRFFMAGVVQTKTHGPGLYEASRLVPYNCWKNRSAELDFVIRQTESVTVSVNPWEIEKPLDPYPAMRHASVCAVPEGKIGSYGHRSTNSLMLGCVPLFTKERYSYPMFHEVINWSSISLHVPPAEMPTLAEKLQKADLEGLRKASGPMRRRLLWVSMYGPCHLQEGEGGSADAFDTLMQVLAIPRRHFRISADHRAPRAPEMLDELYPWLKARGGEFCTKGHQCFDQWRRSCFVKYDRRS